MLSRCSMVMAPLHRGQLAAGLLLYLPLYHRGGLLCLLVSAVGDQPSRALGDVAPDEQHSDAEDAPEGERYAPAVELVHYVLVEDQDAERAAQHRPDPVRAADGERYLPPKARRYELVHRGVDGRILPADARSGHEPAEDEEEEVGRESRKEAEDQVDGQRDDEEFLPAVAVGEVGEEEGAGASPCDVDAGGEADLAFGEAEAGYGLREPSGYVAHDGHFQAVQDPGDPECHHHQPVPASPRQPVHARRYVALDSVRASAPVAHPLPPTVYEAPTAPTASRALFTPRN